MENIQELTKVSAVQLENGTPENKKLVLKSFYKEDKCTISPAKDINGRYKGIQEGLSAAKKDTMGYVPDPNSRIKVYDGMVVDLNDPTWAKDWQWMQYCQEISEDFELGQSTPGAYFYIFRPGVEAAKNVSVIEREMKLMNYIMTDSADNLYNRATMLGFNVSDESISDVKEFLFGIVKTAPNKIKALYESKTFTLELLLLHAKAKKIIIRKGGVLVFGELLLGLDDKSVVSFFSNPKNISTTRAVEELTYNRKKKVTNPLANEVVNTDDEVEPFDTPTDIGDDFQKMGESKSGMVEESEGDLLSNLKNKAAKRNKKD